MHNSNYIHFSNEPSSILFIRQVQSILCVMELLQHSQAEGKQRQRGGVDLQLIYEWNYIKLETCCH